MLDGLQFLRRINCSAIDARDLPHVAGRARGEAAGSPSTAASILRRVVASSTMRSAKRNPVRFKYYKASVDDAASAVGVLRPRTATAALHCGQLLLPRCWRHQLRRHLLWYLWPHSRVTRPGSSAVGARRRLNMGFRQMLQIASPLCSRWRKAVAVATIAASAPLVESLLLSSSSVYEFSRTLSAASAWLLLSCCQAAAH